MRLLLLGGLILLAAGWYAVDRAGSAVPRTHYVEGVVGRPERINPLLAFDNATDADLAALVFSGLMRLGPDGMPLPDLAERWEITPDARTYTFHLRPGLFWHDGQRLTAHDVAFTIGRLQMPGFQGPTRLAMQWAQIEVLAPDDLTVIFRLPAPSSGFLAQATLGIVPAHLLEGTGVAEFASAPFNRAPVGSGPFRLVRLTEEGARLERNVTYHHAAPRLTTIELRFFPDHASLELALASGEVDGALLGPVATVPIAASRTVLPMIESGYLALYFNTLRPPLDDADLRRGLAAAVDITSLAAAVGALPGAGPLLPGSWASPRPAPRAPEDPGAILTAAGWLPGSDGILQRHGEELQLRLYTNQDPERETIAGLIAEQLRAVGVAVEVHAIPAADLLRLHVQPRDFDLLLYAATVDADPDPFGGWHTSQIASGGGNVAALHDPELDDLIEDARATLDTAERRDLYSAFTARFADVTPAVILLYPQRQYVVPATLAGPVAGPLFRSADRFRGIEHWQFTE